MALHWTWSRFAGLGVDNLYDALLNLVDAMENRVEKLGFKSGAGP